MLKIIITILQFLDKSQKFKNFFQYVFGLIISGIVLFTFIETADEFTHYNDPLFHEILFWFLWIFLGIFIIQLFVKNFLAKTNYLVSDFVTLICPLFLGGFISLLLLSEEPPPGEAFFVYFFPLLLLSPLTYFFKKKSFFKQLNLWGRQYNVAFLFLVFISGFCSLLIFEIIPGLRYFNTEDLLVSLIFLLVGGFIVFSVMLFLFSAFWSKLITSKEKNLKKVLRIAAVGGVLSLFPFLVSTGLSSLYISQIKKAQEILQEEGENKFGFQKAQEIWFLKAAFLNDYKKDGRIQNTNLFGKIFDESPENLFADKIDSDRAQPRNTNATSALDKNENAKVNLTLAEYDSTIISELNTVKTTVTYSFQNTTDQNQEVIFEMRLPNAESVVTDLKLGLNLELQGVIAPRGAANQMYEKSLRRNLDPALLQQVGINTYKLRVFPVLSKTDKKTQGQQKVQFTYLSPLKSKHEIVTAPQILTLNLRIDEKTQISQKVRKDNKFILNESLAENQKSFFAQAQTMQPNFENTSQNWCPTIPSTHTVQSNLTPNGIILFFDISRSVAEKENINSLYDSILEKFKETNLDIQLFTYNFDVYKVAQLKDLSFWGYSDSKSLIKYLEKNTFANHQVFIITDDNKFEFNPKEDKNLNYTALTQNKISILQIGNLVRSYKNEIINSVLGSDGDIYLINSAQDIEPIKQNLRTVSETNTSTEPCVELSEDKLIMAQQLEAYHHGKSLIKSISSPMHWTQVAQQQTDLSLLYNIANQFNSFIAFETESQRQDLNNFSEGANRYDLDYQNNSYKEFNDSPSPQPTFRPRHSRNFGITSSIDTAGSVKTESSSDFLIGNNESSFNKDQSINSTKLNKTTRLSFTSNITNLSFLPAFLIFIVVLVLSVGISAFFAKKNKK
ncbi:hypothetical protein KAI58_03800 [Candidatus Gracilibacteria bacterium]|nr:hypothetical protein [Candidatus Gracilibacteria bacterium]